MKGATVADFYEHFLITEVPSINPVNPKRVSMDAFSQIGSLKVDTLCNRYFSVSRVDLDFKYNTIIEVNDVPKDKVAFYMLDYGRGGTPEFGETRFSNSGYVSGGECYFAFNPSLNEVHRFDAQCSKPFYVEIAADYFASLLDSSDAFTGGLKEKIYNRDFFGMKTTLAAASNRVASAIYDCPLQGTLGNLMIEGSLQQFVALQLSAFINTPAKIENIKTRDRDVIHAVKEYLHQTFQDDHSLLELSKRFGINQNKLKKSFKELFGVPVIEYLYNLKMEHARALLYDHGMYVGEVASQVGYKNANHFATAFKRKFGVNPSKV